MGCSLSSRFRGCVPQVEWVVVVLWVFVGCESPQNQPTVPPDCRRPIGLEVDWMRYGGVDSCCKHLGGREMALPGIGYAQGALNRIEWVSWGRDTSIVCIQEKVDEERLWYEWFSSDGELGQYAGEHRNQSDRQPLHLIVAMDYETPGTLGKSSPQPGEWSFIFDCNILEFAKLRMSGSCDDRAIGEYLQMRDYVTLHELGHQFGLEHCSEPSCVMRGEFVPSPVPVSARFCSSAVSFGARQLMDSRLIASTSFGSISDAIVGGDCLGRQYRLRFVRPCPVAKGEVSGGLKALCEIEADTLVVGEPVVFKFKLVNVSDTVALVPDVGYGTISGEQPSFIYVADPCGYEYQYVRGGSVFLAIEPMGLAPGDTLEAVLVIGHYFAKWREPIAGVEPLFIEPGRWGLYCGYFKYSDDIFTEARIASEVDWVDVVERDSLDEEAWRVFWGKAGNGKAYIWDSYPDSTVTGLREIIDRYSGSSFYRVSLYWYGEQLKVKRRYREALEVFRRYRKEFPGSYLSGEAMFDIAECLHQLGRYDEALEAFEEARCANRRSWRGSRNYYPAYEVRKKWRSHRALRRVNPSHLLDD